jgi:hypothetical protein
MPAGAISLDGDGSRHARKTSTYDDHITGAGKQQVAVPKGKHFNYT